MRKSITAFTSLEGEEWKQIEGYPCYQVSNMGRVVSTKGLTPKLLREGITDDGYAYVTIITGDKFGEGKKRVTKRVHRIVAEAFMSPAPEGKPYIDHINTIRNDNRKSNIRWVSGKENAQNPLTKLHRAQVVPKIVEQTRHSVYVYDEDLKLISAFTSTAEAARITNQSQGNISSCCMGSLPRLNGMIWSYTQLTSIEEREKLENASKEKRLRNKKSTLRACAKYAQKHKDYFNEKSKKWYAENKERVKERERRKRAEAERIQTEILPETQGDNSTEGSGKV